MRSHLRRVYKLPSCVIYGWSDDIYTSRSICVQYRPDAPISRRGDSDSRRCRTQHSPFGHGRSERWSSRCPGVRCNVRPTTPAQRHTHPMSGTTCTYTIHPSVCTRLCLCCAYIEYTHINTPLIDIIRSLIKKLLRMWTRVRVSACIMNTSLNYLYTHRATWHVERTLSHHAVQTLYILYMVLMCGNNICLPSRGRGWLEAATSRDAAGAVVVRKRALDDIGWRPKLNAFQIVKLRLVGVPVCVCVCMSEWHAYVFGGFAGDVLL